MKRYIAVARGFDNIKIREVGEEFEFNGAPAPWMKPLDEDEHESDEGIVKAAKRRPGRPPKLDGQEE